MQSHHQSDTDDPHAPMTVVVSLVGVILMLAIVVFAVVLFQNVEYIELQRKVYAGKSAELSDLQSKQLAQINRRAYVDQEKTRIAIPIDEAIDLYVAQVKSGDAPTNIRSQAEDASATQESPSTP